MTALIILYSQSRDTDLIVGVNGFSDEYSLFIPVVGERHPVLCVIVQVAPLSGLIDTRQHVTTAVVERLHHQILVRLKYTSVPPAG